MTFVVPPGVLGCDKKEKPSGTCSGVVGRVRTAAAAKRQFTIEYMQITKELYTAAGRNIVG